MYDPESLARASISIAACTHVTEKRRADEWRTARRDLRIKLVRPSRASQKAE